MRAAVYCRLSEEDRNKPAGCESGSMINQRAMLMQYASERGWEVYGVYSDDDYAGADRSRPAFRRLIADAEAKKFDVVLCKTQSRFTREMELVERYINGLFPLWGIRFISIADGCDTADPANKKSRQINGLVNEWYLEDMSQSIRAVLDSRRAMGLHIGSGAPYGYAKDPNSKGHLIIDEGKAEVVRRIFAMYLRGRGKTAIARSLNSEGIPSPGGGLWRHSAIDRLLCSEVYIGNMVQGKYGSESYKTKKNRPQPPERWFRAENTHEAIISREEWEKARWLAASRAKTGSRQSAGIFAGRAYCAYCGSQMSSCRSRGRSYLRCSLKYTSRNACTGGFISVNRLEGLVLAELNRIAAECLEPERLKLSPDGAAGRLKRQAEGCSDAIAELYLHRAEGVLSESDFLAALKRLTAKRQRLEETLKEQTAEREVPLQLLSLRREAIEIMTDSILIGRREKGSFDVPVEIRWSF